MSGNRYPGRSPKREGNKVKTSKSRYLIVGGCAAGMAAAHAIREHDRHGEITVLSEEAFEPYFRPMIPFVVSGEKQPAGMMLKGCGPYTGNGISVRTGSRVISVDPGAKAVILQDKTAMEYEKILFATGSSPFIPPEIKGTDSEGVFALRNLENAISMTQRAAQASHAVMLGGGLLNLKAAFALLKRGIKVTLVVYSPEVLSQLMDPEDAVIIRRGLENAGLEIRTGVSAESIMSDNSGVTGVHLSDGSQIACQMVCIGKGVRPNTGFLKGSGIRLDTGGIAADRYTRCNLPDSFAAGDVAVTHNPVSGTSVSTALWTNAVEMGRCAGLNMAGIKTAYAGTFGILNATQVADVPFVSMGEVHTKGKNVDVVYRRTENSLRKLVFNHEGTRLVGGVFVGNIAKAGLYRYIIREKMPIAGLVRQMISNALNYGHFMSARSFG